MPRGRPPPEGKRQEWEGRGAFIMTGGGQQAQAQLPATPGAPGLRRGRAVEGVAVQGADSAEQEKVGQERPVRSRSWRRRRCSTSSAR